MVVSTTIDDAQVMAGLEVGDKAFLAFERRPKAGDSGVYWYEFDKKNGTAEQNPEAVIAKAQKLIDSSLYKNRDLDRIFIYSNKDGTDVTITLVTKASGNFSYVYTGRIKNGKYTSCTDPAEDEVRGRFVGFFGFYYDDNTKNKFILFDNGEIRPQSH
jgi:hypothetical protein